MVTLVYNPDNGSVVAMTADEDKSFVLSQFSNLPVFSFDETTNPGIYQDLMTSFTGYVCSATALQKNTQPISLNPPTEQHQAEEQAKAEYAGLPVWVKTGTPAQAETYINAQIFNGMTQEQVNTYIDNTIKNVTTANVAQINAQLANIRTVFKLTAGAIIALRDLLVLTSKVLFYIRDLVIRYKQAIRSLR